MPFSLDFHTLKSVVAIAEHHSFSHAADAVGRTQSALSVQIKKLEESLGCSLFDRTTKHVRLTPQGEIFISYATKMLALQREAYNRLREPDIEGEIRLGTPEDFATHYLPQVLAEFRKYHPLVQLNVACDLTLNLLDGFRRGVFDLVLMKRDPQSNLKGGTNVWREPLVWAAVDHYITSRPISLVLAPQPCIYRARAIAALDKAKIPWHIAYTSPSLAGTLAAVRAGLGMTVLPANMIPNGVHSIRSEKMPTLHDAEIALIKREGLSRAAQMLAEHIIHSMEALG